MKVSIVTSYFNRKTLFLRTLETIEKSSSDNFELIVVDDASEESERLEDIAENYNFPIKIIRVDPGEKWYSNSCVPFNKGFKAAEGEFVIIQNPECCHLGDVVSYVEENCKKGVYSTFSCYAPSPKQTQDILDEDITSYSADDYLNRAIDIITDLPQVSCDLNGSNGSWFNHADIRPSAYHFLSCMSKEDLHELGGFDPRYALGDGYDDNEFLCRIARKRMSVQIIGSPFCLHLWHPPVNSDRNARTNYPLYMQTLHNETFYGVNGLE